MYRSPTITKLLDEMRINVSLLPDKVETMSQFPDMGLRSAMFGDNAPFSEVLPPDDESEAVKIWLMLDRYNCRYILANHPGEPGKRLVGPYILEDMTLTDISRLFQKCGLAHVDINMLHHYYMSLPHIRDESFMDALINAHCQTTYGAKGYEIGYWKLTAETLPDPVKTKLTYTEQVRMTMELRYATEKKMMDCIAEGNYYGADQAISKLGTHNWENRADSTLRNMKNYTLVFNTLCRVAAGRGNVPPLDIDLKSNHYALEIETAGSVTELREIRDRMLKEYCTLVRHAGPDLYSSTVRRAIDILSVDYPESLTLSLVAEQLGISPNYLSAIFKKETGRTFTDYLTEIRLDHAKQLLRETKKPVGDIAAACGFPDQNYFARQFKARVGTTPGQYRSGPDHSK